MSGMIEVNVKGLKKLQKQLSKMARNLSGPQILAALSVGALEIANAAKENAGFLTGTLRRSLHIGGSTGLTDFRSGEGYSDVEGSKVTSGGAEVLIGTNLVYAAIQEFGGTIQAKNAPLLVFEIDGEVIMTGEVNIPAHPYLRPAFDQKKDDAIREYGKEVKSQLRRAL